MHQYYYKPCYYTDFYSVTVLDKQVVCSTCTEKKNIHDSGSSLFGKESDAIHVKKHCKFANIFTDRYITHGIVYLLHSVS